MSKLSPSQKRLASLVALGLANKEIAFVIDTTEKTVKTMLHRLYKKMGVRNRVHLAILVTENERKARIPVPFVHPVFHYLAPKPIAGISL